MHTRRNVIAIVALCSLFMAAWLLPSAAASEEPRTLAEMTVGASRIDWQPAGDSERFVLTIAGPEGLWFRKEFKAGQPASLSLFDENGQPFADGAYTYELRASGLVQSGHFSIRNGSFVTAAAKPPLRNVTANLVDDELIIQGNGCIGEECTTSDDDFPVLRLKGQNPNILFDDVEVPPSLTASPFNDWAIRINPSDVAKFSIFDVDASTTPFSILGGAPDSSLFISDNGDVGIGTATPAERLHVVEDADANTFLTVENPNTGSSALGGIRAKSDSAIVNFEAHGSGRTLSRFGQTLASWAEFLQVSGNGFMIGTLADKPLILGTNSTNRVHITGSGNVGIGTATPAKRLTVKSAGGNDDVVQVLRSSSSTPIYRLFETTNGDGLLSLYDSTGAEAARFTSVAGGKLAIGCNAPDHDLDLGNSPGTACSAVGTRSYIDAGSATFTTSSSRTIKENLKPVQVPGILDKISSVGVYNFDFIEGPKDKVGLMAEDFHTVFGRGSDKEINGQEVEMALWLAVQELTAQNRELRDQNKEISKRLADLEGQLAAERLEP